MADASAFPYGLRVLVVDDDPTWLKILEKMLRKCSYEGWNLCLSPFVPSSSLMATRSVCASVAYACMLFVEITQ
jgi:hypothetical protein